MQDLIPENLQTVDRKQRLYVLDHFPNSGNQDRKYNKIRHLQNGIAVKSRSE